VARVRYLHLNAPQAADRAALLSRLGHDVDDRPIAGPAGLRELALDPPDAVVIDLSRAPSLARDVGLNLRLRKGTRHLPLVYAGGDGVAAGRVRGQLPDAVFASWEDVGPALAAALGAPPRAPIVPRSIFQPYEDVALARKLGIKAASRVALLGAPEGFAASIGGLPEGVVFVAAEADADLTLWFVRSRAELEAAMPAMTPRARGAGLWVLWPKKTSGVDSDLSSEVVMRTGLAAGIVDFKVASVDATWSGRRFTTRRAP
jgi:hypothetical protein